jgi:hypothetical protein
MINRTGSMARPSAAVQAPQRRKNKFFPHPRQFLKTVDQCIAHRRLAARAETVVRLDCNQFRPAQPSLSLIGEQFQLGTFNVDVQRKIDRIIDAISALHKGTSITPIS